MLFKAITRSMHVHHAYLMLVTVTQHLSQTTAHKQITVCFVISKLYKLPRYKNYRRYNIIQDIKINHIIILLKK